MLVIGIDTGAIKTGIAWVNSAGQAQFSTLIASNLIPFRYGTYRDQLAGFLVELEEDPVVVALEHPRELPRLGEGPDEIKSLVRVNCITAVTVSEVTRLWPHTPILSWSPRVWRKQNETKKDVAYRMSVKYDVDFQTDDESDALGIADHAIMRLMGGDRSIEALKL